jgi:hypothetical protein
VLLAWVADPELTSGPLWWAPVASVAIFAVSRGNVSIVDGGSIVVTEIYLCHACSCYETEGGNARAAVGAAGRGPGLGRAAQPLDRRVRARVAEAAC